MTSLADIINFWTMLKLITIGSALLIITLFKKRLMDYMTSTPYETVAKTSPDELV